MIIVRFHIQYKRENINIRIKRSSILLVNQIYELEQILAITHVIATQFGHEFSLKKRQFKRTAMLTRIEF